MAIDYIKQLGKKNKRGDKFFKPQKIGLEFLGFPRFSINLTGFLVVGLHVRRINIERTDEVIGKNTKWGDDFSKPDKI